MTRDELKYFLDKKVDEYNQPSFISADPISIPHLFTRKQDIEIAGFFASIFAWGNRTTIINKSKELMALMDNAPYDFIRHYTERDLQRLLHFKHRTFNTTDLLYFLSFLQTFYNTHTSLESAFSIWLIPEDETVEKALIHFHHYFFSLEEVPSRTKKHIATPERGSHCKRLNMCIKNKVAALLPDFTAALWQSQRSKKAFQHPHLNRDFAFAHKRHLYYSLPATPDLNGALYFNTIVYGLQELLRYADRNSMAHGVEVRLPFLDHQLVELLFSLPHRFKIRNGWTKWLLRQAMQHQLPDAIVWRKEKVGFEPPQKTWMQDAAVKEKIHEAKKTLVAAGILSPAALTSYKPGHAHDGDNRDWRYWSAAYGLKQ